jgi:hypothetical protein
LQARRRIGILIAIRTNDTRFRHLDLLLYVSPVLLMGSVKMPITI